MTKEEAKIQRAIRAARIAKQTLLEETRDRMPLEVDEEEVKVKRPKAENVTIKVPNQDKEGYGLAGVEGEYKIKKATAPTSWDDVIQRIDRDLASGSESAVAIKPLLNHIRNISEEKRQRNRPFSIDKFKKVIKDAEDIVNMSSFLGVEF